MKKFRFVSACCLLAFTLGAPIETKATTIEKIIADTPADPIIVKGILKDSLTQEGEPYATIRICKAGKLDKPVEMTVTDMNGAFSQVVKGRGNYVITFTSVGKTPVSLPFTLKTQQEVNLGTIFTSDDVKQLKGVEVVAQKLLVTMEVDKMNYNMADDPDSKSNNVLDMLRKVPMVTVDGSDNITVNGSGSFKVYVDGKPNAMISANPSTILKYMPASSVERVEVITNPGAKYDAEGVGGVLNLITNKKAANGGKLGNGFNGTLRGMASNKGVGGGVFASVQKDKLSLTFNGNVAHSGGIDISTSGDREQLSNQTSLINRYSADTEADVNIQMGNLDASYELDSLNTFSASLGVTGFNTNTNTLGTTSMIGGEYIDRPFGYTSNLDSKNKRYSINGSFDYQHSFANVKDRILTLSYRISTTPTKNDSYSLFSNTTLSGFNLTDRYSHGNEHSTEHTFQADYTTPLAKGQTLSAGAKYILRENASDNKYYLKDNNDYVYDNGSSLNYKHSSDILAGYTEYSGKYGKVGLKAGLRYEYTMQNVKYLNGLGEDFKLNYGNLVPNADLSYTINQQQNIGLAYNLRISRPGITYLNPYINKQDPLNISYGNSHLDCEEGHTLSMVYNYFSTKWMINLTLRESMCNNGIDSYSFYDDNHVLNSTYGNISKSHDTGLTAFINWNAGAKTRIYTNSSVTYRDLRSASLNLRNNGWQGNLMLGAQQTLPYNYRLSLNLIASSRQYTLQGWSSGMKLAMASLSKTFLNDKLSVSLSCMTPLEGSRMEMKSYAHGTDNLTHSLSNIALQNFSISISYSLNKQSSPVKKAKRTIQNDDLINSSNQTESIGTMITK